VTWSQIAWQVEALGAERFVHVFAELGAVLVALEVNNTVNVSANICNDIASENRDGRVRSGVQGTEHHLQSSFRNVRIRARGSYVIL
jgi:hypothetical protein